MPVVFLERIDQDSDKIYTLKKGQHVIGRGGILECSSKKVSRKHGTIIVTENEVFLTSTHNNPCFHKSSETAHMIVVKNGCTMLLSDGDKIGLLPEEYWYTIRVHNDEILPKVQNNIDSTIIINHTERKRGSDEKIITIIKKRKSTDENPSGSLNEIENDIKVEECENGSPDFLNDTENNKIECESPDFLADQNEEESIYQVRRGDDTNLQKDDTRLESSIMDEDQVGIDQIKVEPSSQPNSLENIPDIQVKEEKLSQEENRTTSDINIVDNEETKDENDDTIDKEEDFNDNEENNLVENEEIENNSISNEKIENSHEDLIDEKEKKNAEADEEKENKNAEDNEEKENKNAEDDEEKENKNAEDDEEKGKDVVENSTKLENVPDEDKNVIKKEDSDNKDSVKTEDIDDKKDIKTQTDPNKPSTSGTLRRERCWYGNTCYRKNLQHKKDFSHPGDDDYDSDPDDNRPQCAYGAICYRRNRLHRQQYKHPPRRPKDPNKPPSPKKRKRPIKKPNNTVYKSDEEDDYDYSDPFLDDGSSDEYELSDSSDSDSEEFEEDEENSEENKRLLKEARKFTKGRK